MEIDINILWLVVVSALAAGGIHGFRRGLVEGLVRIVSYILGIIVLIVLAKGIGSFIQGGMLNVLMALILLVMLRLVHRFVNLLLDSCRIVSRLPVVNWLDKLAGTLLGMVQVVCVIWIGFILIGYFDFGHLNTWVLAQVSDSSLLRILYHTNYIIKALQMV